MQSTIQVKRRDDRKTESWKLMCLDWEVDENHVFTVVDNNGIISINGTQLFIQNFDIIIDNDKNQATTEHLSMKQFSGTNAFNNAATLFDVPFGGIL